MRVFEHIGTTVRTISQHDNMDPFVKPGGRLYEREEPADLDDEFRARFIKPHIPVSVEKNGPVFFVPAEDLKTVQP